MPCWLPRGNSLLGRTSLLKEVRRFSTDSKGDDKAPDIQAKVDASSDATVPKEAEEPEDEFAELHDPIGFLNDKLEDWPVPSDPTESDETLFQYLAHTAIQRQMPADLEWLSYQEVLDESMENQKEEVQKHFERYPEHKEFIGQMEEASEEELQQLIEHEKQRDPLQTFDIDDVIEQNWEHHFGNYLQEQIEQEPFAEEPVDDWMGEGSREVLATPNNFDDFLDHLDYIAIKYDDSLKEWIGAEILKEQEAKAHFKKVITRMRHNRNKGKKERTAKRGEEDKIKMITMDQAFRNRFKQLLDKVPQDHPKANKIFKCARMISHNPSFPYRSRVIALHIILEQNGLARRRYARFMPPAAKFQAEIAMQEYPKPKNGRVPPPPV